MTVVIFVVLLIIGAYLLIARNSDSNNQLSGKGDIKLAVNSWDASKLDADIAKIILEEKMGLKVKLVSIDENAQWPALAKGDVDASLEVWPSGHKNDVKKYIDTDKT
ncbi:MAG: hypothetical protein M0R39_17610, partial [Prolixibacteraceae bacterium]|nr:hypothetical protein [Prolixibacteraceae bacterium]